jgi:hypothetical protein
MNGEPSAPRRILHLVIEDFPAGKLAEIVESSPHTAGVTEIFQLTAANALEALEKIFAADTVAVWGSTE